MQLPFEFAQNHTGAAVQKPHAPAYPPDDDDQQLNCHRTLKF